MRDNELEPPGRPASSSTLTVARALDTARFLREKSPPFVELIETRRRLSSDGDVLVIRVDVELPQSPAHPIERSEMLAITFWDDDGVMPQVLALRADFPRVPHLNPEPFELPRSLCLYEQPWSTVKFDWHPMKYLEQVRTWLALTARGELHQADQPLEPLLLGTQYTLILPPGVIAERDAGNAAPMNVRPIITEQGPHVFVGLDPEDHRYEHVDLRFVVLSAMLEPLTHGVV